MTLCTHIVAVTPCDAHDLFHECRRLLGATDRHPFIDEEAGPIWHDEPGLRLLRNRAGIGLDALLYVYYRAAPEPRRTPEEATRCESGCPPDCDKTSGVHLPACWVEASFDTPYAYRDDRGRGCGGLHAQLVFDLGQWLDERQIGWGWQNEFTGEWHYEDRYRALKDLISGGGQAMAWFVEVVQPLVESGRIRTGR